MWDTAMRVTRGASQIDFNKENVSNVLNLLPHQKKAGSTV